MRWQIACVLGFLVVMPLVVGAPALVHVLNSPPVLDATYTLTQPLPPTLLYIEDFSYDPNGDNYSCSYSFVSKGKLVSGNTCIIYHSFTNITYPITITLNDSQNTSTGIISVTINTSALPEEPTLSTGGGDDTFFIPVSDEDDVENESLPNTTSPSDSIIWPNSSIIDFPPIPQLQQPEEPSQESPGKKFSFRPVLQALAFSIFVAGILLVLFILRIKHKEHEEAHDDFSNYLDFLESIGKK